ncbi:MAG: PhnD/SsuA/transferrin family substrate-binding protein [Planctomycetes bacterium]|nr:PhnD/SsuA/transferrin family substrate-binding protein [Planctomycetota bacterium]
MSTTRRALAVFSLGLLAAPVLRAQPADQPEALVVLVKPGDPNAADETRAEPFLRRLREALQRRVPAFSDRRVTVRLTADPEVAARLVAAPAARLAIVPPDWYLARLRGDQPRARVVATVPRLGESVERYALVVSRAEGAPASLDALRGREVVMQGGPDDAYLRRVVFQDDSAGPGLPFALRRTTNLADEVFAVVEPADGESHADALLVDTEMLRFLQDDELTWPQLRVVWTSPALPRELVVVLGPDQGDASCEALRNALLALGDDEAGREALELMRSEGFAAPDLAALARVAARYDERAERERDAARRGGERRDGGRDG